MVTSYFTPDLAMGQIPRSTERIASCYKIAFGLFVTFSSFLYHLLGGIRTRYTNRNVVTLEQNFFCLQSG